MERGAILDSIPTIQMFTPIKTRKTLNNMPLTLFLRKSHEAELKNWNKTKSSRQSKIRKDKLKPTLWQVSCKLDYHRQKHLSTKQKKITQSKLSKQSLIMWLRDQIKLNGILRLLSSQNHWDLYHREHKKILHLISPL